MSTTGISRRSAGPDNIDCTIEGGEPKGAWCAGNDGDGILPGHPRYATVDMGKAFASGYEYACWSMGESPTVAVSFLTELVYSCEETDSCIFDDVSRMAGDITLEADEGFWWWNEARDYALNELGSDMWPAFPMGNGGGNTFYRLKEGIERFMITDINNPAGSAKGQSEMPVLWDNSNAEPGYVLTFNHVPGGSNVLFMDGHVAFDKYPSSTYGPTSQNWVNKWVLW